MTDFSVLTPLAGGALIGLAAGLLLLLHGRVAGISGILAGLLTPRSGEVAWRAAFAGGLLFGGLAVGALVPQAFAVDLVRSPFAIAAAGLLVGVGTRLGSGCTSGHGVCGIPRGSRRSLLATATFMTAGAATAAAVTHLAGGTL